MRKKTIMKALATALVPALIAGCTSDGIAASAPTAKPEQSAAVQLPAGRALPDFSALVARVGPSVVNISTDRMVSTDVQSLPFSEDDPFFQFFKRFQFSIPRQAPAHGIGSGFIISADGYVLTNA